MKSVIDKAYDLYQLDWMASHGYSLQDVIDTMEEAYSDGKDVAEHLSPSECFEAVMERGDELGICNTSEIFACKKEFAEAEFLDRGYMKKLFSTLSVWEEQAYMKEYELYMERDRKDRKEMARKLVERVESLFSKAENGDYEPEIGIYDDSGMVEIRRYKEDVGAFYMEDFCHADELDMDFLKQEINKHGWYSFNLGNNFRKLDETEIERD